MPEHTAASATTLRSHRRHWLAVVLACALAACARPVVSPTASTDAASVVRSYDVRLDAQGQLAVEATFSRGIRSAFAITDGAESFVDAVAVDTAGGFRELSREGAQWPASCPAPCRVRYRFRLRDAALNASDDDLAMIAGESLFAPPSSWLLYPLQDDGPGRFRFHVTTPAAQRFVTGVHAAANGEPSVFEADLANFDESSFAGFGKIAVYELSESHTTLALAAGLAIPDAELLAWVQGQIAAVDDYLGTRSQQAVLVLLVPGDASGTHGKTLGGGGGSVFVQLGMPSSRATLDSDWTLAHELIHTRVPQLAREHRWFAEGLATYVEPVARVRAGLVSEASMWSDVLRGLPQGLPSAGDRGLDHTHTWGRVYWGGALYFLLADLTIRERSHGTRSLRDVLGALRASGANVEVFWPIARVLDLGDAATGTRVLHELYARLALAPGSEDLARLWAKLGVAAHGESVAFDERAAGAALRRAITER
jgi:hypothetical protein